MTVNRADPWSGIDKPPTGFSVLRVASEHPHSFFWGKDNQGTYLLLLEVSEENIQYLEKEKVDLKGVKTDIRLNQSTGGHYYILYLKSSADADIFQRLCIDLIERTLEAMEERTALEIIHGRLRRWKSFLSRRQGHLLNDQEMRGLYAELEFLHTCVKSTDAQAAIVEGWQGPLNGPHDYMLGDYAVEVKSISGSQKNTVRISSENQLCTHLDRLYLQVFFLAEFFDCEKGLSLNQMVELVRGAIRDSDTRDLFDSRLYETGYMELKDYDTPCYAVMDQKTFEVMEGFPRITPEALHDALSHVSYDLSLSSLGDYVCGFPFEGRQE